MEHQQCIKLLRFLTQSVDGGRTFQKLIQSTQNQSARHLYIPKLNKATYPKVNSSSEVKTKVLSPETPEKTPREKLPDGEARVIPSLASLSCLCNTAQPRLSLFQALQEGKAEMGSLKGCIQLLFP